MNGVRVVQSKVKPIRIDGNNVDITPPDSIGILVTGQSQFGKNKTVHSRSPKTRRSGHALSVMLSVLLGLSLFGGCTTSIKTLRENPRKYSGEDVSVCGVIAEKREIPVSSYNYYRITEDGEELHVLSFEGNKKRRVNRKDLFKGKVYFAGSNDSRAQDVLVSALRREAEAGGSGFMVIGEITEYFVRVVDTLFGIRQEQPMIFLIEPAKID